jgi:hypothetical protein
MKSALLTGLALAFLAGSLAGAVMGAVALTAAVLRVLAVGL